MEFYFNLWIIDIILLYVELFFKKYYILNINIMWINYYYFIFESIVQIFFILGILENSSISIILFKNPQ